MLPATVTVAVPQPKIVLAARLPPSRNKSLVVFVNYILVNKYFQSGFNRTRFREGYVEMGMLSHVYYVKSPKPLFALSTLQKKKKIH